MDVLVKPTRRHHANCSLCMQMLGTLFGREEGGGRGEGGSLMMGRALLSVATQDVIQLQQLPLSVSQFDDTGRICNDDECFLHSLLTLCSFFYSVFPHLPSLGDSTRAIQVLSGGGGFISEQPCVHWSAVCVNTESSGHSAGVWTVGKVDPRLGQRYYFKCWLLFCAK